MYNFPTRETLIAEARARENERIKEVGTYYKKAMDSNTKLPVDMGYWDEYCIYTPLGYAISIKKLQYIEYILKRNPDIEKGLKGITYSPLEIASDYNNNEEVIWLLLENGAKTNKINEKYRPLVDKYNEEHSILYLLKSKLFTNQNNETEISKLIENENEKIKSAELEDIQKLLVETESLLTDKKEINRNMKNQNNSLEQILMEYSSENINLLEQNSNLQNEIESYSMNDVNEDINIELYGNTLTDNISRTNSIYKHLQFRDWISKEIVDINKISNIEYKGRGCDGLVMKCSIPDKNGDEFIIALKMIINLGADSTRKLINRCANEYQILPYLLQLHPNIVRKLGNFTCQPTIEMINNIDESIRDLCYRRDGVSLKSAQFFILEYYEKTLESIITNLSFDKIIKYSLHLARGLLFLYESKIVHLDIKVDNLMISSCDDLVIVDFGVASKLREDGTVDYRKSIGGNTNHLSPEVINARNNDKDLPCTKQYSWELGMIIYEMFAKGEYPFDTYALSTPVNIPNIDLTSIPNEFHELLLSLICYEEDRISILEAWKYLETKFPHIN